MPKGHSSLEPRIAELEAQYQALAAQIEALKTKPDLIPVTVTQYKRAFDKWPAFSPQDAAEVDAKLNLALGYPHDYQPPK